MKRRRSPAGRSLASHLLMASAIAGMTLALLAAGAAAQDIPGRTSSDDFVPEIRAQLTARRYTTLSSEMAGRIDRLATRVGDSFRKGDVLVAIDCSVQRAQLARADAVVTQAEKTYAINQRLFTLRSIGQLELEVSQAEVLKAKADQAMARAVTTKCTILAPFDGVTVEQKAREFQYASPGLPIIEVLDNGALEIELIAPSRWLNFLKPGTVFSVHVDEINKTYPARVTRLSGRVDPVSQSVKVIGEITATAPELLAGMSGNAKITTPR